MKQSATRFAPVLFLCLSLVGCISSEDKASQLSGVAKGWCLNIRASQVIPVYPLTEDVQVGDVFVVQQPIEDEVYAYESSGFLPLTHHLVRLSPLSFKDFYEGEYGVGDGKTLPAIWKSKTQTANQRPTPPEQSADAAVPPWSPAPRAAFPTYSFGIQRGAALDMALPVQGVPVAFGFLGSDSATASVSLSDAYTYGLGEEDLHKLLEKCVSSDTLRQYQPTYVADGTSLWNLLTGSESYKVQYSYVRVISRVYFVRGVNVSVIGSTQAGAHGSGGIPPVSNLLPAADSAHAYGDLINALNGTSSSAAQPTQVTGNLAVGGSLKVASAINNSVSMNETFDRPVVIGYLAFDIPIGPGGKLGETAVATTVRLNRPTPVLSDVDVQMWADFNPAAEGQLKAWIGDHRTYNYKWLAERKFPTGAHKLLKYLQSPPWVRRNPYSQTTVLCRRLATEILERPEGISAVDVGQLTEFADQQSNRSAIKPSTKP